MGGIYNNLFCMHLPHCYNLHCTYIEHKTTTPSKIGFYSRPDDIIKIFFYCSSQLGQTYTFDRNLVYKLCTAYRPALSYKYFTGMILSSSLRVMRLSYMHTTPPCPRSVPGILSRMRKADMSFLSGSACFLISIGYSV